MPPSSIETFILLKHRSVELQCHVLVGGPRKTLYTDMVIAAHAICVRTTMLSLCTIANFLGSQPQDKHNASSNSKMSWREFPLSKCKNMKNAGSAITFPAFFMLAHKYL